jgi:hypothetical protein
MTGRPRQKQGDDHQDREHYHWCERNNLTLIESRNQSLAALTNLSFFRGRGAGWG